MFLVAGFPHAHHASIKGLEGCFCSLETRNCLRRALSSLVAAGGTHRMRFLSDVCRLRPSLDRIQAQFVPVCLSGY